MGAAAHPNRRAKPHKDGSQLMSARAEYAGQPRQQEWAINRVTVPRNPPELLRSFQLNS